MSLPPSDKNGVPFSTLTVLTFYSDIVFIQELEGVYRLAAFLEGSPVHTHELKSVTEKWRPYLGRSFPEMLPLTHEHLITIPTKARIEAAEALVRLLSLTVMIRLPEE